mmetsp:Transcript_8812/g.11965  ORF Transcript_8812/g.11965 Transcript_8812/m.11965 type:complete len:89 (-) Transcript_8812:81-347(-)
MSPGRALEPPFSLKNGPNFGTKPLVFGIDINEFFPNTLATLGKLASIHLDQLATFFDDLQFSKEDIDLQKEEFKTWLANAASSREIPF